MQGKRFVIRVYGLIHHHWNEVLVAEEFHFDTFMRKFPGGGLEFGEGPAECLYREMQEELNLLLPVGDLLHTTRVFIQSAFNPDHQVLGIYYLVEASDEAVVKYRDSYLLPSRNGEEQFKWVSPEEVNAHDFTFPADQQAFEAFLNVRRKVRGY